MPDKISLDIGWVRERCIALLNAYPFNNKSVYGVPNGGAIALAYLAEEAWQRNINLKLAADPIQADYILDDLIDSGSTFLKYQTEHPSSHFICLTDKRNEFQNEWIEFPWEAQHPKGEQSVHENIVRILQYLGEDINREGLQDTPNRVVKSWDTLFGGYHMDIAELMTTFENESEDAGIVLLQDIEMYSTCEHHMLPFYGKAHVAYIPDKELAGISKLARVVEVFSRRLQNQERIGNQVVDAIMTHLNAKAAACIIEAKHMCICTRGVNKQNSVMKTSALRGLFMDEIPARQELFMMINS